MLDARIYRTGLVGVLVAAIVAAFSLSHQGGSLTPTLAPDAFNGQNALTDAHSLARDYPNPTAGSIGDADMASAIAGRLGRGPGGDGFDVQIQTFKAATPGGSRTLENVIAARPGLQSGTIVVVANRDAVGSATAVVESGTGVMLDLGRVLSGETLNRTVVLASTSGSTGAAGAAQLVHALPGPVDAVLVLGDMASASVREPVVVPWSSSQLVAPTLLRNTVAGVLGAQAGVAAGSTSFPGQFLHLAFPFTISDQAPFAASGVPAVLLSASGERHAAAAAQPNLGQITRFGRTALQVITALDAGRQVPAPSAYLLLGGNVVPAWAIRLLVLGLILPVLGATVDGFARARRRGHRVGRWIAWVLEGAAPFVLGLVVVLGAKAVGALDVAPPSAAAPGAIPVHARGVGLLVGVGLVVALSLFVLRRYLGPTRAADPSTSPGAAAGLLVVMCAVSLAMWVLNPFAAALMIPALHLWTWVAGSDARIHPVARLMLLLAGLAPFVIAVAYYMVTLGYGPVDFAWTVMLMLAGGQIGVVQALAWSVALGCAVSVGAIGAWTVRRDQQVEVLPVTVRGPVTYAGPGSLGGTESALRR